MDELVHAVREYLANSELHREKRRWVAEYVCGHLDGKCGERMAEAILHFASEHSRTPSQKARALSRHKSHPPSIELPSEL
jgi:hypothetical protein